jgi:hypothetical protein
MKAARSFKMISVAAALLVAVVTISYGASLQNDHDSGSETKNSEFYSRISEAPLKVEVKNPEEFKGLGLGDLKKEIKDLREKTKKDSSEKRPASEVNANKQQAAKVVKKTVKKTVITASRTNSKTSAKTVNTSRTRSNSTAKAPTISREERIRIEQKRAEEILAYYISRYPILQGVRIYVRDCPNNWEGCAYYTKGIILVDPDHRHSLEEIIAHEVKHIIDWREDGKIDYNDYHK